MHLQAVVHFPCSRLCFPPVGLNSKHFVAQLLVQRLAAAMGSNEVSKFDEVRALVLEEMGWPKKFLE